jgi:hypothetical protein
MTGRCRGELTARAALLGAVLGLLMASPATVRAAPAASQPAIEGSPAAAAPQLPGSSVAAPAAGPPALSATGSTASANDIRDIRGPKPIASPWLVWGLVGAGILAVLLAYLLWRWTKRRRRVPEKKDFEIALARLDDARALMQPGRGREFSIEVSGIVREYIERRFKVMAAHRTTHEFLHDLILSADPGLAAQRDLLGEFLQSCDLAKFGGWNLGIDQMDTMLKSARRFVQSAAADPGTAPAGAPPAEPRGGAAAGPNIQSPSSKSKSHVSLPTT